MFYDRWQTRRVKQKWSDVVSHIAAEPISSKMMPRKMTIYLAAPPGDGLRSAREHFHDYVKDILVAAAMDWDVVEGRKEGDVRFKTAERIRRKRKRAGEGEAVNEDEAQSEYSVETVREKNETTEYDGVAGDLVIGRHTWKEYVRGLHEGWLGPADVPKQSEAEEPPAPQAAADTPGHSSVGDASVKTAAETVAAVTSDAQAAQSDTPSEEKADPNSDDAKPDAAKKEEEEKPKRRHPPPTLEPQDYATANLSRSTPETIGPSTAIRFPHILGIRNTPTRIYRFLTHRRLADDVGRQVAAAVLASHRSFDTVSVTDEDSASSSERSAPEQEQVLAHEEKDWMKSVREPRKEHEESVWIESMVLDERIASRMRRFELTAEDEDRAKRIADGTEKVGRHDVES